MFTRTFLLITTVLLMSCSLLEKEEPSKDPQLKSVVTKPLPPEKTEELLGEAGSNWLYGQGVGETAVTAGAIFAFPPYALYVVGNGILSLTGYKQIRITDALPEEPRGMYNEAYDTVTSAPGRVTAAIAGKEFRNKEVAKEKIINIIKEEDTNEPGRDSYQAKNQSSAAVGG